MSFCIGTVSCLRTIAKFDFLGQEALGKQAIQSLLDRVTQTSPSRKSWPVHFVGVIDLVCNFYMIFLPFNILSI